ncbi:MAG: sulfatase, partial [Thermoanaerobaculia bacterium]
DMRVPILVVALPAALVAACSPRSAAVYEAEYLFADHLGSVIAVEESRSPLSVPHYAIGYDERRVLFQHAPSRYRFPQVPSGPGARFLAAPAMDPRAWEKPTDGVVYEVRCQGDDGSWQELLALKVSPATDPEDRVWHDREVPLDRCSQPQTQVELSTSCGPQDHCAADWAAWGLPRVVHRQTFAPRSQRLALLISIDTLRPDRLGLYGAARGTSPELERLARDAVVFETAVASSPWTIPSHATMLTSADPRVHGADAKTSIAESVPLLAEILKAAGWQTAGFVDTAYLGRDFGFDRGFEHFDDDKPPKGDYRRGVRVTRQRVLDWLAGADDRPAFVFWHIMDAHGPYWASAPFSGMFRSSLTPPDAPDPRLAQLRDLAYHDYLKLDRFSSFEDLVAAYDEGIAAVDSALGGLLDVLRDAGLYDQALIVVTSDHGESFLDHGVWVGHGLFLTDDEIRVPLIIKLPGNRHAGRRVREMVGVIDVAPSVLDALGVAPPDSFQGRSLLSPAPGASGSLPESVYGISSNTGAAFLRTQSFKFIGAASAGPDKISEGHLKSRGGLEISLDTVVGEQLYHLRRDPQETTSIADHEDAALLERFRLQLARHAAECAARREGLPPPSAPELTAEAEEQLRALGYVD